MPYYMLQTTYTSEARSAQSRHPDNIIERANVVAENLGGNVCPFNDVGRMKIRNAGYGKKRKSKAEIRA